jgi:SEC-C motif-containing protein
MTLCPCGTGNAYAACCEPLILGECKAPTAEALMRSRFAAYARKEVDYVYETTHPEQRKKVDRESIKAWAEQAHFRRLEILKVEDGKEQDQSGLVEFIAHYQENGEERQHHEHARFEKLQGSWYFDHRRSAAPSLAKAGPQVGRNEPCPCGSGRKFKKCCGGQ